MPQWLGFWLFWGLLFRGVIAWFLPAGFDEAYYYLYAHYPQLSYFDHPLLVGLTTGIGTWITGMVTPFTIRLTPLLLYTGTLYFLYRTGKQLFSPRIGVITVVLATTIPFFQVGFGVLTLPDSPLMFFWAWSLWIAAEEFFARPVYVPSSRIVVLSITIGLACLGKYHGFLLGAGLVLFCLSSPPHRKALWSPWTALGLVVFIATIGPLLHWNSQHDWVSFTFQSARAIPDKSFRIEEFLLTFLVGNAYLFPSFGFPMWWISMQTLGQEIRSVGTPPSPLHQRHRFILAIAVPIFWGFTLMGGYRQVLPSWPMPGFFTATLLLGERVGQWHDRNPQATRHWLVSSGGIVLTLLTVALLHVSFGIVQKGGNFALGGGFWEPKNDPSTQLVDVVQLRHAILTDPILQRALGETRFIFCNNFFLGGQVGMALAKYVAPPITTFDQDLRGFAFWEDDRAWVGQDALYITSDLFQEDIAKYSAYFRSITFLREIPLLRGGKPVQRFLVYRAQNLLKPYPRPYGIGASPSQNPYKSSADIPLPVQSQ